MLALGPVLDRFLGPPRSSAATRRRGLAAGAAAGVWSALAVLRYQYFGLWGPNTSFKVYPQHLVDRSLPQGLGFAVSLGVALPVACWGAMRAWRSIRTLGDTEVGSDRRPIAVLVLALTFGLGFHFAVGGDYRAGFRYLVPTTALWLVVALVVVARAALVAAQRRVVIAILVAVSPLPWTLGELRRDPFATTDLATIRQRWLEPFNGTDWGVSAARWIAAEAPSGALVAYGQMGKAPTRPRWSDRISASSTPSVGWIEK